MITFSNNEQGPIIPGNSIVFTDFFGVKRLPPANNQNSNSQFGGDGLELRVEWGVGLELGLEFGLEIQSELGLELGLVVG